MANKYTYQILRDTTTDAVIKLTGTFDGSGNEANNQRIQANTLYGALANNGYLVANNQGGAANTTLGYYNIQVTGLKYFINFPATSPLGPVEIFWNGGGATVVVFDRDGMRAGCNQEAIDRLPVGSIQRKLIRCNAPITRYADDSVRLTITNYRHHCGRSHQGSWLTNRDR